MSIPEAEAPILLLIDLQQGLVEGSSDWGPRSTPQLTENVSLLLSAWRTASWPVLHVHHDDISEYDNPISSKFPITFAAHACATPLDDEKVFIKHVGSPFIATGLLDEVKRLDGKRKVVVVGMDGAQCINNTTRNGADLGLEMVVCADACASYGMRSYDTEVLIGAEETHNAAMSMLKEYANVVATGGAMWMFALDGADPESR